ncbi:MAG: RHS repeat protein, partial [Solirubrobacteraceae bacterium]|nr:RHS repeat protein [Solirubrobacteraceae bacterium]
MPERSEPFLAERVWAHPSSLTSESITTTTEFDDAGRPVRTTYSDGETETYTYDDAGRLIEIDEHKSLWATVDGF